MSKFIGRHLPFMGMIALLGLLHVADCSALEPARLTVTSTGVGADGRLSVVHTCDGAGVSPPVSWSGAPEGTKCFALSLWHTARDREKSYWVVYDIPADVTKLDKDDRTVGRQGHNDKRRPGYEPMCSKGPGLNTYNITVFALAEHPKLPAEGVTRSMLLEAIRGITLAEGTLSYQYQRNQKN